MIVVSFPVSSPLGMGLCSKQGRKHYFHEKGLVNDRLLEQN